MRKIAVGVLAVVLLLGAFSLKSTEAVSKDVILLYGWNGTTSSWNTAKAQYEAAGYTVHILSLPRGGSSAGDTAINADYVEAYIASQSLSDAKLDGHSLGGWLALTVAVTRQNPNVGAVVVRDTGYGCFFGIPGDQCSGSVMLAQLNAAPQSSVPILNLSSKSTALPQEDAHQTFSLSHNAFLSDAGVTAAAISWQDTNVPVPTPTPTPTPTPCSWWDRLFGRC